VFAQLLELKLIPNAAKALDLTSKNLGDGGVIKIAAALKVCVISSALLDWESCVCTFVVNAFLCRRLRTVPTPVTTLQSAHSWRIMHVSAGQQDAARTQPLE